MRNMEVHYIFYQDIFIIAKKNAKNQGGIMETWMLFDTWECYTCGIVVDRQKNESFDDWEDRIYLHVKQHPTATRKIKLERLSDN